MPAFEHRSFLADGTSNPRIDANKIYDLDDTAVVLQATIRVIRGQFISSLAIGAR
jgi:hypothetical protein